MPLHARITDGSSDSEPCIGQDALTLQRRAGMDSLCGQLCGHRARTRARRAPAV